MKQAEHWRPSKFVLEAGRLRASRDPREVGVASRFVADLIAEGLGRAIPLYCRGHLLDLGCGKVPLFASYQDRVESVTTADWSNTPHGGDYVDVVCDLTGPLPFGDAAFDTVMLTDVIEHISAPGSLVSQIARVLAPRGLLVGTVPFLYWIHEEPHDHYRYTSYQLRKLANDAGLEIESIEPLGGGLDVVVDAFAKCLAPLHWRVGPWLADLLQRGWSRARAGRLGRHSRELWDRMPIAYLFVMRKPHAWPDVHSMGRPSIAPEAAG